MPTRTVHPTRIPNQPAWARIESLSSNRHSDGRWRVTAHETRRLRVDWRFSSPKTRATRPDHKPRNFWRYSKVLQRKHTKSDDIGSYPTKIYLKPIRLDEIRRNLVEIQRDLVVIWPDLNGSGHLDGSNQNNDIGDKNRNRPMNPKTWRDLNRLIRLAFRVGFGFYFDSPESFGSGPN